MVGVKILSGSNFNILDGTKVYKFGNRRLQEVKDLPCSEGVGMLELPIISVLSTNYNTEIACFTKGSVVKRYESSAPGTQIASSLLLKGGFIRTHSESGVSDGIKYRQSIYIYRDGTDVDTLVQGVLQ